MTDRDAHYRRLEHMYRAAPANEYFRPEIRIDDGTAEVRLTVRPDFFHAANAVHGSVYFKLLDDATDVSIRIDIEQSELHDPLGRDPPVGK